VLVLRWLVLLFPVWWEIKWWRVGFLTRTLRAATMVRGSGDIVVDVVACWSWVANVYSVSSFGVVAVGSCRAWCFFRLQTLVLASRADELSWVCLNSDMILFGL
jgi:hypothetical protein